MYVMILSAPGGILYAGLWFSNYHDLEICATDIEPAARASAFPETLLVIRQTLTSLVDYKLL